MSKYKQKLRPTHPDLFRVTLIPVENSDEEALYKSMAEDELERIILLGAVEGEDSEVKDD